MPLFRKVARGVGISLAVAALAAATTGSAAAQPPLISPAPFGSFDVTGSCAFTVHIDSIVDGQTQRIFFDRYGNPRLTQYTGPLVQTVTNIDNDKSISLNIPVRASSSTTLTARRPSRAPVRGSTGRTPVMPRGRACGTRADPSIS